MANSVDPDQTAPSGAVWSGSALFAYVILSETLVFEFLGHLRYHVLSEAQDQPWYLNSLISLSLHSVDNQGSKSSEDCLVWSLTAQSTLSLGMLS